MLRSERVGLKLDGDDRGKIERGKKSSGIGGKDAFRS